MQTKLFVQMSEVYTYISKQFIESHETYVANNQERPGCYGNCLRIQAVNSQED